MSAIVSVVIRSLHRFLVLEGFDRAMALAGQMFAALLPLLIVVGAVSPTLADDSADTLIDRLELSGSSAEAVQEAVADPAAIEQSISALSVFILVLSALSFTRALQRLYVRAWGLEKLGLRANAWGLVWLGSFAAYLSVQPVIVGIFDGASATFTSLALACGLWLFTPWILVGKRIPWRRLLPQAVLTAAVLTCVNIAGVLYVPRAVASAATQFGVIGVAFALLSWLFVISFAVVVTAAVGAVVVEPRPEVEPRLRDV